MNKTVPILNDKCNFEINIEDRTLIGNLTYEGSGVYSFKGKEKLHKITYEFSYDLEFNTIEFEISLKTGHNVDMFKIANEIDKDTPEKLSWRE